MTAKKPYALILSALSEADQVHTFLGAQMRISSINLDPARTADVVFICRDCGVEMPRRVRCGGFTPAIRCRSCQETYRLRRDKERAAKAGAGGYKLGRSYFVPTNDLLVKYCGFFACSLKPISQRRAKSLFSELDGRFERIEPGTLWPRLQSLAQARELLRRPVGVNAAGRVVWSLVPNNPVDLLAWNDALWGASKHAHRVRFKLRKPCVLN